ncbi:MAG: hypothetical protein ACHQ6T_19255, partial [Myxococcota bacterium]
RYTTPTTPYTCLNWKQFPVDFTAARSLTEIAFYNGCAASNYLAALDDVSLVAVPAVPAPVLGALQGICLAAALLLLTLLATRARATRPAVRR